MKSLTYLGAGSWYCGEQKQQRGDTHNGLSLFVLLLL